jgi:hypothetical protein
MAVRCKSSRVQAVVHVVASALPDDQVGGPEHRQVLGHGGLRDAEFGGERVHAQRVTRLKVGQQLDQAQAGPVAEGLVDANKAVRFDRRAHKSMVIYLIASTAVKPPFHRSWAGLKNPH